MWKWSVRTFYTCVCIFVCVCSCMCALIQNTFSKHIEKFFTNSLRSVCFSDDERFCDWIFTDLVNSRRTTEHSKYLCELYNVEFYFLSVTAIFYSFFSIFFFLFLGCSSHFYSTPLIFPQKNENFWFILHKIWTVFVRSKCFNPFPIPFFFNMLN